MNDQENGLWLTLDMPPEAELQMELQCRAVRDCDDTEKLREVVESLIRQNTMQQLALAQAITRVAELESEHG